MDIILILCTILAVLLLVFVLVYYLVGIINILTHIGGNGKSYLAKLRLGLRAIETETGHLPTEVGKLNHALSNISDGLKVVNENLEGTVKAAVNQKDI